MRRFVTFLVSAALTTGALLAPVVATESEASAQEIQLTGPLAGAPAARKLRLYREGRFELAPTASFTLLDEYRRTILFGGRLQYHIKDWLGVGLWGAYGVISSTTDLTDQIGTVALRNSRTAANLAPNGAFGDQTAKMTYVAAPQITFVPFRGKLAIFQKIFVDTDAYLHGGVAFVGLQERGDCGAAGQPLCTDPKSFELASRTAIAPTFGLGLNFYVGELLSIGLEYRALPFSWNRAGFDSRGSGNNGKFPNVPPKIDDQDQTFKFNQMITIALGISLPTHAKVSD